MTHPVTLSRTPDDAIFQTALFDDGWEVKPIDARGAQATFDVPTAGQDDRGLRIALGRGEGRNGAQGNGYGVEIEAGAVDASLSDADRLLTLTIAAGTTLAQLKAVVDALAALSSVYFGGEAGAGAPTANPGEFAAGTPDLDAWVEFSISASNVALFRFGAAAPANNNAPGVEDVGRAGHRGRFLRAGERIYTNRGTGNDVAGSIAIWRLTRGEIRRFGLPA